MYKIITKQKFETNLPNQLTKRETCDKPVVFQFNYQPSGVYKLMHTRIYSIRAGEEFIYLMHIDMRVKKTTATRRGTARRRFCYIRKNCITLLFSYSVLCFTFIISILTFQGKLRANKHRRSLSFFCLFHPTPTSFVL